MSKKQHKQQQPNEVPSYDDMPEEIRTEHNYLKILKAWIITWRKEMMNTVSVSILIDKIRSMSLSPNKTDDKDTNRISEVYAMGFNQALLDLIDLLESGEDDDKALNQGNDYPS